VLRIDAPPDQVIVDVIRALTQVRLGHRHLLEGER
jgi:hypothetical protein